MTIKYEYDQAYITEVVVTITCIVCGIPHEYPRHELSTSHVSDNGKRPGVFFTFQCKFCLTWHSEVGLYKTRSDFLKKGLEEVT